MSQKRILLVATGGTIASVPQEGGLAPALSGAQLTEYVPQLTELADIEIVQPMNIDSTNMNPSDWLRIAHEIKTAYNDFDGFVVLHGTDTMAYTAAALSYLIQGSPKPIVLTGSQQPMGNPFTDARLNVYQSILYATDDFSHDVSIVFGGQVIVGTRAHKQRTMSFNAFNSVNYPLPAVIRSNRIVRDGAMGMTISSFATKKNITTALASFGGAQAAASPGGAQATATPGGAQATASSDGIQTTMTPSDTQLMPKFYNTLNEHVIVLRLTPGLSSDVLTQLKSRFDAIVLETFGIGGIPLGDHNSWEKAIFDWVESGRTLALTTQVSEEGLDLGVYEVGRAFAEHPDILKGDDMTTEALVAKTMWALGQSNDPAQIRELFYRPVNHDRMQQSSYL